MSADELFMKDVNKSDGKKLCKWWYAHSFYKYIYELRQTGMVTLKGQLYDIYRYPNPNYKF